MDSLSAAEGTFMDTLPIYRPSQTMAVQSAGPLMEIREHEEMESGSEDESEDEEEEMEMDTEEAGTGVEGVVSMSELFTILQKAAVSFEVQLCMPTLDKLYI